MYVCMYGGTTVCMWRSRTTCRCWLLSFQHASPGDEAQVIRLGRKCLYLLSHLAGSLYFILVTVIDSTAIQLQCIKLDHAEGKGRMMEPSRETPDPDFGGEAGLL